METPTNAQIDEWNAAVRELAEREGIDVTEAATRLGRLLDPTEARLATLECEVKELKRQVEAIEFAGRPPSQHDQPIAGDEPIQYIPQDPDYQPQ